MGIADNWKQTFVCCVCRKSARRKWSVPVCPFCNEGMIGIGTKWRVPKKDDDKEWALLAELIQFQQVDLERQHEKYPHAQTKHVLLSGCTLYAFKKSKRKDVSSL